MNTQHLVTGATGVIRHRKPALHRSGAVAATALLALLLSGPGAAAAAASAAPAASFADLVEKIKPAVVNISAKSTAAIGNRRHGGSRPQFQLPPGSPHERFFRRFFNDNNHGTAPNRQARGAGSGFIVDPGGYVVTNHHVIENADEITVVLDDGEQLQAEVHGVDRHTDLALLKVDAPGVLPHVEFGDSDKARVGDWVIAIGNPFGLGGTTTSGIISARGRDIRSGAFDDFIQVDAPINRGNSGGPLFDTEGKVIGVNTAIISPNGGNIGIGFAVPSAVAAAVVADLQAGRSVERGWLGVTIQPLSDEIAEALALDDTRGALVSGVKPDSPASAAGLVAGDVILRYNGKDIGKLRDLPRLVAQTKSGERAVIEVWRDGKRRTLRARISKREQDESVALASDLGMTLATVDADTRRRYRLDKDDRGVVVTRVEPGSPAAERGIRPGDRIVRAGRKQVSDPDKVFQAISKARQERRKSILLLIEREEAGSFIALPLA